MLASSHAFIFEGAHDTRVMMNFDDFIFGCAQDCVDGEAAGESDGNVVSGEWWNHEENLHAHIRNLRELKCDDCREKKAWTGCDDDNCLLAHDSIHVTDALRSANVRVEELEAVIAACENEPPGRIVRTDDGRPAWVRQTPMDVTEAWGMIRRIMTTMSNPRSRMRRYLDEVEAALTWQAALARDERSGECEGGES